MAELEELRRRVDEMRLDTKEALNEIKGTLETIRGDIKEGTVSSEVFEVWSDATAKEVVELKRQQGVMWTRIDAIKDNEAKQFRAAVYWAVGTTIAILTLIAAIVGAFAAIFN